MFRDIGYDAGATPENVGRCRHDRFPHPVPLSEGEGDLERAARDFRDNDRRGRHESEAN